MLGLAYIVCEISGLDKLHIKSVVMTTNEYLMAQGIQVN